MRFYFGCCMLHAFLTFIAAKRIVFKDRNSLETALNKEAARVYD